MEKLDFNKDWYVSKTGRTQQEIKVNLPHDAMLYEKRSESANTGSGGGYFEGGKYLYRKEFFVPEEWREKNLILEFEGVYQKARVLVNQKEAGGHLYGYTNFFVPLNQFLQYGQENEIQVLVDNSACPNSRWYSGSGIYREVHLYIGNDSYILPQGVQITVENADTVTVKTMVHGEGTIQVQILDQGIVVTEGTGEELTLHIPDGKIWSAENPYLYQCNVRLIKNDIVSDEETVAFGLRTIDWNPKGLFINGKETLLRGACVHHDNGILGACCFRDAEYRRVRIMKEAGFNAIRSAHNPMSKAMLDACDELGMYVMDETFDQWLIHKTSYDYAGEDFQKHWKEDTQAMVLKDYNHPSVIMYSIGNEISELGIKEGQQYAREISAYIKKMDSKRAVTSGVSIMLAAMTAKGSGIYKNKEDGRKENKQAGDGFSKAPTSSFYNMLMNKMGMLMDYMASTSAADKATKQAMEILDISGYNYAYSRYKKDGKLHPERVIVGSETLPKMLYKNWQLVKKLPYLTGDFMWTGWDYLGEAGIGVIKYGSFQKEGGLLTLGGAGVIDICGHMRPETGWNRIIWGIQKQPVIAVEPVNHAKEKVSASMWRDTDAVESWSWEGCEGTRAKVWVYANASTVELQLNGRSMGKKKIKEDKCLFNKISYEPGKLEAVAFDEKGKEVSRTSLESAIGKTEISLKPEKTILHANGQDLCFITVQLTGENKIRKCASDQKLYIRVEGAGTLQGFGSARPNMKENYYSGEHTTYYGRLLAVIRAGYEPGIIRAAVAGDNLETKYVEIQVV